MKWVEPQSLHWTLNFLGNVEQRETGEICAAVADAALEHEAFDLQVCGAGAFPTPDRPRTLWLGVGEGRDQMIAAAGLDRRVARVARLPRRGPPLYATPHHRPPGPRRSAPELAVELAAMADYNGGKMLVDEVTIFSSELTRQGPVYDPLGFAPLG